MLNVSTSVATLPFAPIPTVSPPSVDPAAAIFGAAQILLPHLERGQRIDAATLRAAMEIAFGASDASGAWDWKMAYDACEASTVLFLRRYGKALFRKAGSPVAALPMLERIVDLLPTHTRRSQESEAFQQFSTPVPLGFAVLTAAAITPADRVLEPSAGTGLLAILAEISGGELALNELAQTRAGLLSRLFPTVAVTSFDAAQIDDHLDHGVAPSVVLMNPPFSTMANVEGRMADAALRHIASALARLTDGGRLVAITGANVSPEVSAWREAFIRLQERGRVVFTASIDGAVFARHGTTFPTRLIVIDKLPADDPSAFPVSAGTAPDVATLIAWIGEHVPARLPLVPAGRSPGVIAPAATARSVRGYRRTIYVHPGSGAETRLLTITQRERNQPVSLAEALARLDDPRVRLLINERSGRAAVQVSAPSLMLDDGEIERRVRLIRPMEHHQASLTMMAESHWVGADKAAFAASWTAELANVPEFTESTIHIVAGLLLPIWKRLPNESSRVYRLQTDDAERIIGRRVSAAWAAGALATGASSLIAGDAFAALLDGKTILDLTEGLQLRRSRVMGVNRIELSGFTDTMRDRLSAYGLFHEIISWKLRMFVPTNASGSGVLAKVLERYPVERIGEREAA
jgi:predicted RNA methylase